MRGSVLAAFGIVLSIAATGCVRTPTVTGPIVYPAKLPVRTFPRIWISTGHLRHEALIADDLAMHLRAGSPADVRRVHLDDLEPRRLRGEIPPATVVVILEARIEEHWKPAEHRSRRTVCHPPACSAYQRGRLDSVPTIEGELTITAYDGPTADVLHRTTVEVVEEAWSYQDPRRHVVRQLAQRAKRLMDGRVERVRVALLDVDVEAVRRAQRLIDAGDWHEGRTVLERAADSAAVRGLSDEQRARVCYDLGLARRFDPTTMDDLDAHFGAAERSFRAALRLDARPLYADALRELREHRKHMGRVHAQRRATEHNYRVARFDARVPEAPSAYDHRRPEPHRPQAQARRP